MAETFQDSLSLLVSLTKGEKSTSLCCDILFFYLLCVYFHTSITSNNDLIYIPLAPAKHRKQMKDIITQKCVMYPTLLTVSKCAL